MRLGLLREHDFRQLLDADMVIPLARRGWLLWIAASAMALSWFGSVVYNITQVSFGQGLTPERLLGAVGLCLGFLAAFLPPLRGMRELPSTVDAQPEPVMVS